ncbi:hypothetical protein P7K49_004528 [Saguinus oedipus]|uniref:Ubiquitinyl hydrolase 1 n=1 Tax=Saguinus oedipus TaxID=9490 RepID=A0ABQ9W7P0_SAGOE|nr:hypothetical protein P7K49_004528 [Saguinus oedipus]
MRQLHERLVECGVRKQKEFEEVFQLWQFVIDSLFLFLSEEDMYRAADEIEKEKELLIHERGASAWYLACSSHWSPPYRGPRQNGNSEPRLSVAPEMDIMDYCKKEWRGNTQKATCMKKYLDTQDRGGLHCAHSLMRIPLLSLCECRGYEEVSQKFTSIRRVRGDNYCALRATLFQAMSQAAGLPPWLQDPELTLSMLYGSQSLCLAAARSSDLHSNYGDGLAWLKNVGQHFGSYEEPNSEVIHLCPAQFYDFSPDTPGLLEESHFLCCHQSDWVSACLSNADSADNQRETKYKYSRNKKRETSILPEKLISKYNWIRQWKLGLKFDGKNEDLVDKIKESLTLLRKKKKLNKEFVWYKVYRFKSGKLNVWAGLAEMRTAEARQIACDELFTNEEEEYSLYEAVKFLMLNRAIELYNDKEKGKEVPFFSVLLFARDTSNDPGQLLRNHLNQVGHTGGLEQVEMFLLAYAVRHTIQVYRLSKYNTEEFITVYPTDPPKDWPVVTLIAEDDRHYNIPVRVCEETSL